MTLGSGIFASTALLLLAATAWLITTKRKWKIVGKITGAVFGLCLLLSAGIYAWSSYTNRPPAPYIVTELAGVKLGMSPIDVTLALGEPAAKTGPAVESGATRITYSYTKAYDDNYSLRVMFYGPDKFATKVDIVCEDGGYSDLFGISRYSSEATILERLGKPDTTSIRADGLAKTISYARWKTTFEIAKGNVVGLCVHDSPSIGYTKELPTPAQLRAEEKKIAQEKAAEKAAALRVEAERLEAERRARAEQEAALKSDALRFNRERMQAAERSRQR